MWSNQKSARNRVSPVEEISYKQNGFNHVNYWDDLDITIPSKQRITNNNSVKNGSLPKSKTSLTKLIRRRKYDEKRSHYDTLLKRKEIKGRWRQSLNERKKNKLFEKPVKSVKGCDAWKYKQKQNWRKFKISCKEVGYKLELWRSWFKRIEGHQGTGVLSYFVFLKWIFFLNIYLFLLVLGFIVIPPVAFSAESTYTTAVTSTGRADVITTNTDLCSDNYNFSYATSGADVIQDFIQGTGWMEKTALFYGWYPAKELNLGSAGGRSLNYLMPFGYFMTALGVLFLSLLRMARFTIASFKENLDDKKDNVKTDYCNKVFGGWDYALDDEAACKSKKNSIYKDIVGNLDYQRYMLTRSARSTGQKCKIYTIRFLVNFFILAILGGAGYLIYWVNDWSTDYLASESSSGSLKILIVEFLPSLTITILNVLIPLLFGLLVQLEDYTEDFVIKITLIRTVFLRLASLAVLMVSLYVTVTCSNKTTDCNVGQGSCTEIKCWETYVGQAFYKLIVLDFFVHILVIFCYELPRKLFTTKCSCTICEKVGPAEFDVSKCVLDLVYSQALCWIGFLYCPLITAISVIAAFTQFYLKLFSALFTTIPPLKPYKASKSNNFFMIVLMVTFFLCCFPVGYSMVKIRPSTGCGPFRIYADMSVSVNTTIDNFPSWLKTIVEIFTSTAFILSILTVLCLTVYYLYVRGKAHNERAETMKEQLIMEGKDKQFLLAKIYEITGEGQKPKGHPKPSLPPPTVKTENEIPNEDDTKKYIDDDVPPPPAYEEDPIQHREEIPMEPVDDWEDKPVELVVASSDINSSTNTSSTDSPKKHKKSKKSKSKSKISPSMYENDLAKSNMPFDF